MPAGRSPAALPDFAPQLATLVKTAPEGDAWLHESKLDGYRIAAALGDGQVRLLSRSGNDWSASFPTVRDAVARLPVRSVLLEGEVAAVRPDERTSFQDLQRVGEGRAVLAPFVPQYDWDTCLAFARGGAETIAREYPRRYSTSLAKQGREDKILLDYLRNNRGSTAVAAFSTRARPHAPVAVPIEWDELTARLKPDQFTLKNVRQRLRRLKQDPWRDYWKIRQRLSASALRAVGAAP